MDTINRHLAARRTPLHVGRCEFCNAILSGGHTHAVDTATRNILSVCGACYLQFTYGGRFRSIPARYIPVQDAAFTEQAWHALRIPVDVAFLVRRGLVGAIVACYPGPAGIGELKPSTDLWDAIVRGDSLLLTLQPDVEAVVVRRPTFENWIVPIDACYELFERLCRHWTGSDGGEHARAELDAFVSAARKRSTSGTAAAAGLP